MKTLDDSYLSVFCLEMAEILKSGIMAGEGFLLISEQEPDKTLKSAYKALYEETVSGMPVAKAMEKTGIFPEYMLRILRVGEETGAVEEVFRALSAYYERQANLRKTIRSAVGYPLLLLGIVLAVFIVFLVEVLPVFENVFSQIGAEMLPAALLFLNIGRWLSGSGNWLLWLLCLLAAAGVFVWIIPQLRNKVSARLGAVLSGGTTGKKISEARLASALSLCVSGAADLDEALHLCRDFSKGNDYEGKLERCIAITEKGESFSKAITETALFAPVYCRMLSIGEKAGSVDVIMREIARRTEEDMDAAIDRLTGRIEPATVIILSVCVGLLLISVMLPLVGIMSAL